MQTESMEKKNQILAVVCFVIGLALRILTNYQVTAVTGSANGVTPESFPKFVAYMTMVASVGLFIQSTIARKQGYSTEEFEKRDRKQEGKVLLVFVMLVAYTALCGIIGFFLASEVFVVAFLLLMSVKKWWHYAIAMVLVFVIYYCFRYLLFIHLPQLGLWII